MKRKLLFEQSFASSHRVGNWSKRNIKNQEECPISSHYKYWFDCHDCFHEFEMQLNHITNMNCWCPYCSSKQFCKNNCKICFEKSFASCGKAIYWSKKNKKIPVDCSKSSTIKYLFDCPECNHEFKMRLYDILRGRWCPYCSNKKLCNYDNCKICFEKSFASCEKAIYWSKKNPNNPRDYLKSSDRKCWFDCPLCKHEFIISPNAITNGINWCPYCANKKLCNYDNCKICFEKSFASHEKSEYWSKKNEKTPRECFKNSSEKKYFNCENCNNEFNKTLASIIHRNSWCPNCRHKTELKVYNFLKMVLECLVKRQFRADWCRNPKTNRHLPFDFVIEHLKLIFEIDGRQHNSFIPHFHRNGISDLTAQQERDSYKEECAKQNGYKVIRFCQESILYDKYDWKKEMNDLLNTFQ